MRRGVTAHVFGKEIREMVRDKRVFYTAILGPVFLVVLFLFLFGFLQKTLKSPEANVLYVVGSPDSKLIQRLQKETPLKIRSVATLEEGKQRVASGDARIVISIPEDYEKLLSESKPVSFEVVYDEEQPAAHNVLAALSQVVEAWNKEAVGNALEHRGLPKMLAEHLKLERHPVKHKEAFGGVLASLLPYLVVVWAFYGGFSIASDLVAGEKERSTLETLLVSPANRSGIAMGKFWALTLLCFTSGLASLVAVAFASALPIQAFREVLPQGFGLSAMGVFTVILLVIPLAAFFAALLLAVSAFARNIRECQSYLTLISFVVLMPAVFSQFIGYTQYAKQAWVNWTPILNSANVLRAAMSAQLDWKAVSVTLAVNVVLALIGIRIVTGLFSKESVLWRI